MSDSPLGPPKSNFPEGTTTVYANFYRFNLDNETVTVTVKDNANEIVVQNEDTYSGTGWVAVALSPPLAGFQSTGSPYLTIVSIMFGSVNSVSWTVGASGH